MAEEILRSLSQNKRGNVRLKKGGPVFLDIEKQIAASTYFVNLDGATLVGKFGLSSDHLDQLGLTGLGQAKNELRFWENVPEVPGLHPPFDSGYYKSEACLVILYSTFGEPLPKRLGYEMLDCVAQNVGETLYSIQNLGWAHGDTARRNMLIDYSAKVCRLIDCGHSRHVAAKQSASFYTKDLLYGSDEAVLGRPVTLLGDWQGLLYTLVGLLGTSEFVWAKAADAGNRSLVVGLRQATHQNPDKFLEGLPPVAMAIAKLTCELLSGQKLFSLTYFAEALNLESKKPPSGSSEESDQTKVGPSTP